MIRVWLDEVVFTGGISVKLKEDSILIVVGPNNSGKSVFLSAVKAKLVGENPPASAVKSVSLARSTSIEEMKLEFAAYLDAPVYRFPQMQFHESNLNSWWDLKTAVIGPYLSKILVSDLPTRARLADCDPPPSFDARVPNAAEHPFQIMYANSDMEAEASVIFRRAFKRDFVIHRAAGNVIPAYVGNLPALEVGEDRISPTYLRRVEKMDSLEKQGDGVRSFVSIVARVLTEARPIQLIDEPEAFLHPPQARMVAENIASSSIRRQTLIATHSSEVLRGLLIGHADRVSVVRLSRSGENSKVSYLETGRIADLWRDPILRFSNILDGIFHDGVIVTEADADCRFYETIANAAVLTEERPDVHYTYSGGKDRLPTVVAALRGLHVPVATIVDFDVLNNEQPLRRIVEAHGGEWSALEDDWRTVKAAVESRSAFLGGNQFKNSIQSQLKLVNSGEAVPKRVLQEIRTLTRQASPWDFVKSTGMASIPAGDATITAHRLLAALRILGIFVAPNGEMEGFCRSIGSHGPRWVEAVLLKDVATDPDLSDARSFIQGVFAYLRK
jgi:predicted ATPase